jgi:hypothetical protein
MPKSSMISNGTVEVPGPQETVLRQGRNDFKRENTIGLHKAVEPAVPVNLAGGMALSQLLCYPYVLRDVLRNTERAPLFSLSAKSSENDSGPRRGIGRGAGRRAN